MSSTTSTSSTRAPDVTEAFFDQLSTLPQAALRTMTATLRFDLDDGHATKHWFVSIDKGHLSVSRRNAKADSVIRTDKALFERILAGEANAMAAMLRGQISTEGNPQVLVSFQRLVPGPNRENESSPRTASKEDTHK